MGSGDFSFDENQNVPVSLFSFSRLVWTITALGDVRKGSKEQARPRRKIQSVPIFLAGPDSSSCAEFL